MPISEHPGYGSIEGRLRKLDSSALPVSCIAFRMIKPRHYKPRDMVSGLGGFRSNGRWGLKNRFRCTYLSHAPETALQEILAATRRKNLPDQKALPRVLVCVDVRLRHVLDLTDGRLRKQCRISQKLMVEELWWRGRTTMAARQPPRRSEGQLSTLDSRAWWFHRSPTGHTEQTSSFSQETCCRKVFWKWIHLFTGTKNDAILHVFSLVDPFCGSMFPV